MRVSDPSLLGPAFDQNGKENITLRNLLLHNAGFPPDPNPNYCVYFTSHCILFTALVHSPLPYISLHNLGYPEFGCPQTANYHPTEDFSCQEMIYHGLLNQASAP